MKTAMNVHAAAGQGKRNSQPAWDRHDERRTDLTFDLTSRDLEAVDRPLLRVVNFADQIDNWDGSVLDVTAAGA